MAGTHGDLISEIGRLVMAAHAGETIDLAVTSEELASRYAHLGLPADGIARAIARSLSAVGVSMTVVDLRAFSTGDADHPARADGEPDEAQVEGDEPAAKARSAAALFPSGVRLALLS